MSNEQEESMGTAPVAEHKWLEQLIGEWTVTSEMWMGPDQPAVTSTGTESVRSLGGLWAFTEGKGTMPNGKEMNYFSTIGWDVSFKEYRGAWFADMSSHLWKQVGELSADGKKMTLTCEGPHMEKDGETAMYRDVIEIIDANNRTLTSLGQDEHGEWKEFMKAHLKRV